MCGFIRVGLDAEREVAVESVDAAVVPVPANPRGQREPQPDRPGADHRSNEPTTVLRLVCNQHGDCADGQKVLTRPPLSRPLRGCSLQVFRL